MAKTPKIITGQVAAITGGARGIGKATARAFIREGMKVAIGDLDAELARATAAELGDSARGYPLDVTDRVSFERFLDAAEGDLGAVDVIVNNAGIMPVGVFATETDGSTRRQVDINIHGVVTGSKLAAERFIPRRRGHLVNIASSAGKAGIPGVATYCGTKHFVVGLSEALRGEWRDHGIEVTCVMPAFVNTELTSGLGQIRGVKNVSPDDVAAAIVAALKVPKFDVYVPRSTASINKVLLLVPRAARESLGRALKADRVMLEVDSGARTAYELRASHSEPSLEPGAQPRELTGSGPP